jgi:membrane-associated protein
MEIISWFIDLILHLDKHLVELLRDYGVWVYLILFIIIFAETGFVVTPFLPGDSLLFAAGAFAASGSLSLTVLILSLIAAAVIGDTVNYWVGHFLGARLLAYKRFRLIRPEHLAYTHEFYEKYGGKTIILARFVPIVRTFAPFVAGVGRMNFFRFWLFNIVGGIAWVLICILGGVFFGRFEFVQKHFELVIVAIVVISVLPMVYELIRARRGGGGRHGGDGASGNEVAEPIGGKSER